MHEKKMNAVSIHREIEGCLLCHDAPCTLQCPYDLDPAKVIRSLYFDQTEPGKELTGKCAECQTFDCVSACLKGKYDRPIRIPEVMIYSEAMSHASLVSDPEKIDLSIEFCGVLCENPFFLSSSVVASNYEMVARAFDMGWAGACFKTIGTFVPEETSPRFSAIKKEGAPFIGFKNIEQISDHTLEENLSYLKKLKNNYPSKVIIASILGQDEAEWTYLAQKVTEAGADIIECNFSCPHMSGEGLGSDVGQNPEFVAKFTAATRRGTTLPILAKMTPNLGNMEPPAIAAIENGANGIAAINTIKSIMNIDLDDFTSKPNVSGKSALGGYSGKTVKPIALRFIHDMKKHPKLENIPISGMGGVETWTDAAEFIAMGCGNIQITTSVMQYGYRIIEDLIEGLSSYLEKQKIEKVDALIGLALPNLIDAEALDRKTIVYPKIDRKKCIGCGRCYLSCMDGGHQAIQFKQEKRRPLISANKCVGCHLCALVCPVNAISEGARI